MVRSVVHGGRARSRILNPRMQLLNCTKMDLHRAKWSIIMPGAPKVCNYFPMVCAGIFGIVRYIVKNYAF